MFTMAKWEIILLVALIILAVAGGIVLWENNKVSPTLDITLPTEFTETDSAQSTENSSVPDEAATEIVEVLWVDVTGAVQRPGVYQLPMGARVAEAIELAGGTTEEADPNGLVVSRAAKLEDEQRIHVPRQGEVDLPTVGEEATASAQNGGAGCININSASQAELESLPGIGKVRAQNTVSNRPFGRLEELLEQKIVPQNVYHQIADQICL